MKHPHRFLLTILSAFVLLSSAQFVHAKDQWLQVHSKNFYLIGNASEKDIRKVGVKLEEFRETFRLVFPSVSLTSPIPTNVIVFKSDSAFKPFKPRRNDGKADTFVAGFFQPGPDANYIAVSADGDDAEMYKTIFHEYVHFIVNTNFGKSEVPPWFNEGLAEYYSTFAIENDQKVMLGIQVADHILLLQQSKLMPLDQLFKVTGRQWLAQGHGTRSILYAESWALIHYLIFSGKGPAMDKFLNAVLKDVPEEKAFQDAFQMTYAQMESELKKYVNKNSFQYYILTLKNKLDFDSQMQVASYGEADTNARLGDFLYHTNRFDDAEPFLTSALNIDPNLSAANTTMGMVKLRQRKFDEAKQYLEKAASEDQKNHMALYQYAYLLSREGSDDLGFRREISKESAEKIRAALTRAIAIAPDFGESYDLLAFVALVTNEHMDEAVGLLKNAVKYQPGNESYVMRIAELYVRQGKLDEASAIVAKFAKSSDDEIRQRAEQLSNEINGRKNYEQQMAEYQRRRSEASITGTSGPVLRRRESDTPMSEAELAKARQESSIRAINEALRPTVSGEKRVLGYIEKIECKGSAITYQIRTVDGALALTSKDFQGLSMTSFVEGTENLNIGCNENVSKQYSLLTYKDPAPAKPGSKGELVAVEFVPTDFRVLSSEEMQERPKPAVMVAERTVVREESSATTGPSPAVQQSMRDMMLQHIRDNVRKPAAGEKQELAFLQKIECTNKGVFFNMKTGSATLRLLNVKPESLPIKVFTPDLGGFQLECNASILDFPAVLIYLDKPDAKLKTAGTIVSLDFVPKNFSLN
jgi:tetratricopeptide (TPR) repeat protein